MKRRKFILESPSMMDRISTLENLKRAHDQLKPTLIKSEKMRRDRVGNPTEIDPASLEADRLLYDLPNLSKMISSGEYTPRPVLEQFRPKTDGGVRRLGIPSAVDRLVGRAVLNVLGPIIDPTFHDCNFGFRLKGGKIKGGQIKAVEKAVQWMESGAKAFASLDILNCFDTLPHLRILQLLERHCREKSVVNLVQKFMTCGSRGSRRLFIRRPHGKGLHQGATLSAILSNVLLNELDRYISEKMHQKFVRYADNVWIFSDRPAIVELLPSLIDQFLEKLGLRLNPKKTVISKEPRVRMLGFILDGTLTGRPVRTTLDPNSAAMFLVRLREELALDRDLDEARKSVEKYISGWTGYFGHCSSDHTGEFAILREQTKVLCAESGLNSFDQIIGKMKAGEGSR